MALSDRTPLLAGNSTPFHMNVSSHAAGQLGESQEDNEQEPIITAAASEYDTQLEKRLVRKYDLMLLPFLSLMYLFSSLDRSSLGKKIS